MYFYAARQPILDKEKNLFAYELLFRDSINNVFPDIDGDEATSKMVEASKFNLGISEFTGNKPAFINFTLETIEQGYPEMLTNEEVVVEILETVKPGKKLLSLCKDLVEKGYTLALDDYIHQPVWAHFYSYVKIIKVDWQDSTIEQINEIKLLIANELSLTTDSRTKVEGEWVPMNKELLRAIGRPRANIKQIRRRLNAHPNQYSRISYSATWQRPVYVKNYESIKELLDQFTSEMADLDRKILAKHDESQQFAMFYPKEYSAMDGNFKLREPITKKNDDGSESLQRIRTHKISSPIYLLYEPGENLSDIEIRYKLLEKKNKQRATYDVEISKEPILQSLPVYLYKKLK